MNSSLVSAAYRTITNKNLLSNLYFRTDLSKFGSPFFELKVIKKTLDTLKIEVWDNNWTNSDPTYAQQTKQWFPNINLLKTNQLLKLTQKGLGLCIQFLTGHNWLLRHKRYYSVGCTAILLFKEFET